MSSHNSSGTADPRNSFASTRRSLLKGVALSAAAATLSAPFVRTARAADPLRISNFGGFFEQAFAKSVYPAFTAKTGIAVQSIPQSGSSQFLIQLGQAVQAGSAPMDICCAGQADVIRGRQRGLWSAIPQDKLKNTANILDGFVYSENGMVDGVGAMAWYITMVANPEEFETLPDSWTELWKPRPQAWGLQAGGTSVLLDIVASTYFDGPQTLDTEEGIDKVIAKIAELKPNAKLWWTDEGSMQSAYQNGEVVGGLYFHDVSMIMKSEGTEIASIAPKEGAVLGYNAWCVPKVSDVDERVLAFLDWSATPECHELIARHVGAAPLIERSKLGLSDAEFAAVSFDSKPIVVASAAKVKFADYISNKFLTMLSE